MNDRTLSADDEVSKAAEAAFAQNDRWAMKFVFPLKTQMPSGEYEYMGLTKRELFAAMAMQGQCANGIPGSHHSFENTAREAVAYADALLKELAK